MAKKKDAPDTLSFTDSPSLRHWEDRALGAEFSREVVIDCGWGRLIFAQTFSDNAQLLDCLRQEQPGKRDIAIYLRDPHVLTALAPQEVFLDPSHTYRLSLARFQPAPPPPGLVIRPIQRRQDAEAMRTIYLQRKMVPAEADFVCARRNSTLLTYLVAEDQSSGQVIGTITGVDHRAAFADPEHGASLWALAVDAHCQLPGVGAALVCALATTFKQRGCRYLDLSVVHDNAQAIALYEKLGFVRVPVFALKHKNAFNEPLYIAEPPEADLNPYATIIVQEARRRGIAVEVLDAEAGYFELSFGARAVVCRESLSELTTAIAMSRCDDKAVTHRLLHKAGLRVPAQRRITSPEQALDFLAQHPRVVVKPARGEQGAGISVDVTRPEALQEALARARQISDQVLLEEYVPGDDLRIIVIDFRVVAAAVRKPPQVIGTGRHTLRELIERQSRRRAAATGGESRIPLDEETLRCVEEAGVDLDTTLPAGETLVVRKTANLHTGGTIHDVTDRLHPKLREAAETAARAIDIPVTGLDFITPSVEGPDYVIIEANERPGLANHEPQPTAKYFVDLLFPQTAM